MTTWKQERPAWCPHPTCEFLRRAQDALCCGKLPEAADHGEQKVVNTHWLCMNDGESLVVDWHFAPHDCDWLRWVLDAIDGKETSWLSKRRP